MRCVIISGSPDTDINFIKQTIRHSDYVICADKGYLFAKEAEITPNLIVGDFDSYIGKLPDACEIITLNSEKDDTDTAHCVELALKKGFDEIIILGACGGRLDHTLANLSTLLHIESCGAKGVLLSENEKILMLKAGEYSFKNLCGKTFSLFPFGCKSVCVSYCGVKYPLDSFVVSCDTSLGTSNIFTSDDSKIKINDGNAIVIINYNIS